LLEGDDDFSGRWRAVKIAFAKSLPTVEPPTARMLSGSPENHYRTISHQLRSSVNLPASLGE
jgi:hypothetical protein